jgi:hypothetical protein
VVRIHQLWYTILFTNYFISLCYICRSIHKFIVRQLWMELASTQVLHVLVTWINHKTVTIFIIYYYYFFVILGSWSQCPAFSRQASYHFSQAHSLFALGIFQIGSWSLTWGQPWATILPPLPSTLQGSQEGTNIAILFFEVGSLFYAETGLQARSCYFHLLSNR